MTKLMKPAHGMSTCSKKFYSELLNENDNAIILDPETEYKNLQDNKDYKGVYIGQMKDKTPIYLHPDKILFNTPNAILIGAPSNGMSIGNKEKITQENCVTTFPFSDPCKDGNSNWTILGISGKGKANKAHSNRLENK